MTGERSGDVGRSLRALAHPVAVGSLVLLALNDHVLKQAWPGFVTGKLSDVVGLVVAPLVVAVLLAVVRAPRPDELAAVLTGLAFTWVKTTGTGSDVASAAWSAVAGTSYLRADPTDLLALPALLVALRIHRLAGRPRPQLRARAVSVVGAVVLPFAVLASAATSPCDDGAYPRDVIVLEGRWSDQEAGDRGDRRLVYLYTSYELRVTDARVAVRRLDTDERDRVDAEAVGAQGNTYEACDPQHPLNCWRSRHPEGGPGADPTEVDEVVLWASSDGGTTWDAEVVLDTTDVDRVREAAGEVCGKPLRLNPGPLAVLATGEGPVVAVTLESAGVAVRAADGDWRWVPAARFEEIRKRAERAERTESTESTDADGDGAGRQADPHGPAERDPEPPPEPLTPVPPVLPQDGDETRTPIPVRPSPTPTESCASPVLVTVTPDPRNGEPFLDLTCPASPAREGPGS